MSGKRGSFQDHVHGAIKAPHKPHSGKPSFGDKAPHHKKTPGPGGKQFGGDAGLTQAGLKNVKMSNEDGSQDF
jgi:hypothetical protein